MTPTLFEQRILELRRSIDKYNYEYYILNAPTISDLQYDRMMQELKELEEQYPQYQDPNSPTQKVGSDLTSGSRAVRHKRPMLSLDNTYREEEVLKYYDHIVEAVGHEVDIVGEIKFDGISISLIYSHGVLTRAVTRGDGVQGDDVTASVRAIPSVPLKLRGASLPDEIEVRGEILLPWSEFRRLNDERSRQGLPLFANPRNAVAGTIKQLSPRVVNERRPTAYFYYLLSDNPSALPHLHHERLALMSEMGLLVSSHYRLCKTGKDVLKYIEEVDALRASLPVASDGVVLKVDDYDLHDEIGYTAKSPKWAIAYKYAAEKALTVLKSVDFQVGRTGVITPVANLESVRLSGTTVSRASLHNIDFIRSLDLRLGDHVWVEKGGEIIPKITAVEQELRSGTTGAPIEMPTLCPACGEPLSRFEGEAGTYCTNTWHCPPQITGRIEHFTSRKAMKIEIGPETITALYERGFLKDISDLYTLTEEQILQVPLYAEKSAQNLLRSIEESKATPFERVFYALGIKFVGETVARLIVRKLGSIEAISQANKEELEAIDGIGPIVAGSVVDFFADKRNQHLVEKLAKSGLHLQAGTSQETQGDALSGEVIVISGTFRRIDRDALKELIERHGGKNAGSISSKTTLLVVGEKVGPAKLEKARQLGTTILTEQEFFAKYPILS